MNTQKRVNERLQKIALKNQKVDLSKIDDLLMWSKGGDSDPFDELAELVQVANRLENKLYNKLKQVENKKSESDKLRQMAKDLGADDLLNTLNSADKLLELKQKNIRAVIKLIQRAKQDNI